MPPTKGVERVILTDEFGQTVNPPTEAGQRASIPFNIPEYDKVEITYVASGDGVGEIETVVYKLDGTTVATLTMAYNTDDKLVSVTKS